MYIVVGGPMVDVLQRKGLLKSFHGIFHAENVMGILERQWSRKISYVVKWKL